jgi:hypothetical protein
VGSVAGGVGGGEDVLVRGQQAPVVGCGVGEAGVVDVEADGDRGLCVVEFLGAGHGLDGDEGAHQVLVEELAACFHDPAPVAHLVGDQDVHGVVVAGEVVVEGVEDVGEGGHVQGDHRVVGRLVAAANTGPGLGSGRRGEVAQSSPRPALRSVWIRSVKACLAIS